MTLTTATPPGTGDRYRELARTAGLAEALRALCHDTCPGALPAGPAGHAIVPANLAATATAWWSPAGPLPRDPATEETLGRVELAGGDLVILRRTGAGPDDSDPPGFLLGLARLRLGVSEALLDAAIAYLDSRRSGDTSLLLQQMVKGSLADAVTEHLEARLVADAIEADPGSGDTRLGHLHRQVSIADRIILRLLGAYGFTSAGPGQSGYASELLASAWVGTSGEDS